ncbi:MAG: TRAP transporter small permease subunit [Pseudomonadota bacterium]
MHAIDAITQAVGRVLAICFPIMVLLTAGIVAARYLFDAGAIAVQEAVMYLHAATVMLGLGYALRHDAHVRVDVLANRLGPRARAAVELAGHLLFLLPVTVAVIWFCWDYVAASWRIREGSPEVGGIPGVFLLKTLLPLGAALLLLQGVAETLRTLTKLRTLR